MNGFSLLDGRFFYYPDTNTLINAEIKNIYSKYGKKRRILPGDIHIDKDAVISNIRNLKQIVFEVSQRCNMSCRYCIFESGTYLHHRNASSKIMDFATAGRAIDYIADFIDKRRKKVLTIGFYGGEPNLNFGVIEKIVDYSKAIFRDWEIIFSITTNGTKFNDAIIQFLIENNFKILISLDGPAENHDSKRVFPDGTGTFDIITENLKKIKTINEDYYYENVNFSIVHSKDQPFEKLHHFYTTNDLVNKNMVKFGFVNEAFTTYYSSYDYDMQRLKEERERVFALIENKMKNKEELYPIESELMMNTLLLRDSLKRRNFNVLASTCFYDDRVFIATDGKFHICEKMNDKFSIGSVGKGFDYPKMIDIVRGYLKLMKKHCSTCDVRYLCMRCYANFAKNGKFEIEKRFCENINLSIKKKLERLIRLNEIEGGVAQ